MSGDRDIDRRIWKLFDGYVHGANTRREFLCGARHGFHNDTTPRYDEKAAELAWTRTVEFFNRHLDTDG